MGIDISGLPDKEPGVNIDLSGIPDKQTEERGVVGNVLHGALHTIRPFGALQAAAIAPLAHKYESKNAFGQIAESFSVSGKAFVDEIVPEWETSRPDYEREIVDLYMPDMPEPLKPAAGLAMALVTDPSMLGLVFMKSLKEGIRVAEMTKTSAGPWRNAVEEAVSMVPMRADTADNIRILAKSADEGDDKAADEIVKAVSELNNEQVVKQAMAVDKQATDLSSFPLGDDAITFDNASTVYAREKNIQPASRIIDETDYISVQAEAQRQAFEEVSNVVAKEIDDTAKVTVDEIIRDNPVFSAVELAMAKGGLSKAHLSVDYSDETLSAIDNIFNSLVSDSGRALPADVAKESGFNSLDDMIVAMKASKSRDTIIKETRDSISVEIKQAADEELQSVVFRKELDILNNIAEKNIKKRIRETTGVARKRELVDQWKAMKQHFQTLQRETANAFSTGKREGKAQAVAEAIAKKERKTAKQRIGEATGAIKIKNLVDERIALRGHFQALQRETANAFRAGKLEGAIEAKAKAAEKFERYKELVAVRREVSRIEKNIMRAVKNRTIPIEYKEHLNSVVGKYYDIPKMHATGQPRETFIDFLSSMSGRGDYVAANYLGELYQDVLNIGWKSGISDMSLDELKVLDNFTAALKEQGWMDGYFAGREAKESFMEAINDITDTIRGNLSVKHPKIDPLTTLEGREKFKAFRAVSDVTNNYFAMLYKPEFMFRHMDGGKEMGTVHGHLFKPLVEAENAEFILGKKVAAELQGAFNKFSKKGGKWSNKKTNFVLDNGKEVSISKEKMVMIALNSGNDGNRTALREGFSFSDKDIDTIVGGLDEEEKKLVDDVWKILDGLWPDLERNHLALTGNRLKKVSGKYFPLIFDRKLSWRAESNIAQQEMKDLFATMTPHTKPKVESGHRMARKGGKLAPRLEFDVIGKHIDNVVHDITHAIPVRNVQRMITNNEFREAVTETMGEEAYKQLLPWLQHVAKPIRDYSTYGEAIVGWMRRNTTVAFLGLKASVFLAQPMSVFQTINEIGLKDTLRGYANNAAMFSKSPRQWKNAIHEMSPAMEARSNTWNRELMQFYSKYSAIDGGLSDKIRDSFFWLINVGDQMVSYPTWLGAYQKGLNNFAGDAGKAIEYADMVIRRTQPVATAKDLAEIQRGPEWRKATSMFYTFFSGFQNQIAEKARLYGQGKISALEAFKAFFWLVVAPSYATTALQQRELPTPKEAAKGALNYVLGAFPWIRDILNPAVSGFGYAVSPAAEVPESISRVIANPEKIKNWVNASGLVIGLPTRQAVITVENIMDGTYEEDPFSVIVGKKKEEKKNKRVEHIN